MTSRRDERAWLGDLPVRITLPPMPLWERVRLARAVAERHGRALGDPADGPPLLVYARGKPQTLVAPEGQALRRPSRRLTPPLPPRYHGVMNGENPQPAMLRAELHCHTYHSHDCRMRPERIVETCLARGIGVLAITDHDAFEGALELAALAPPELTVIPGEEIKTTEGEIIGYFLTEQIPRGLSPEETAERIRAQGGVVNVPHPFDTLRGGPLRGDALERLARLGLLDMIEGFNARIAHRTDNHRALLYARSRNLPVTASSDAHCYAELGTAWTELPPFDGPREFVAAVRAGRMAGRLSPWAVHLASTWARVSGRVVAR